MSFAWQIVWQRGNIKLQKVAGGLSRNGISWAKAQRSMLGAEVLVGRLGCGERREQFGPRQGLGSCAGKRPLPSSASADVDGGA
jgi:hypothetical protein